ncbi:PQQ-dependent sugar dehydrogenase [Enemella sp. A6]|uniref:PQQ-dependent sugar dehydrogenase n=1 Tax=Enemella sp. A6 TaxID=3440152 RepID=UPI003EB6BDD5
MSDWTTGLTTPWGIDWLPDGDALVTERDTGLIKRIDSSGTATEVGRIDEVVPSSEGGLLGIAVGTDTLFLYYSTGTDNRLVSVSWDGERAGEQQNLLTEIPVAQTHNGGQVRLGPDGYLYVSTGDAQTREDAQDRNSLAGKILRLTPQGAPAPGNPFGNEVYSLGHRNVQGLAFDDQGRLWASEFGDKGADELNLIESGGNYGWPTVEGYGEEPGMINPQVTWPVEEASPSGLAFWRGSLWMAGLRGQRLWQIPVQESGSGDPVAHLVEQYGRLRAVAADPDDDALVVGTSNTDGRGDPADGDDRLLRLGE